MSRHFHSNPIWDQGREIQHSVKDHTFMMNDSRPMNETYPSLPFENSIHNPFLNHISSFRAFKSPRVVRKEAAKDWKSYYFLLPYPLPHAPFISLFNKHIVLFQDLKKRLGLVLGTTKSLNRRSHCKGSGGRDGPSTSSNDLLALLAFPNTDASSLDGVLSAEGASVAMPSQTNQHQVTFHAD